MLPSRPPTPCSARNRWLFAAGAAGCAGPDSDRALGPSVGGATPVGTADRWVDGSTGGWGVSLPVESGRVAVCASSARPGAQLPSPVSAALLLQPAILVNTAGAVVCPSSTPSGRLGSHPHSNV